MRVANLLLASLLLPAPLGAQEAWREPPPELVELLDARPAPVALLSPDARRLLFVERPAMPPLADVMRPWVGLAGIRIDTAVGARRRTSFDDGLLLVDVATGAERRIELPAGLRIASVAWSHTGRHVAFSVWQDVGVDLWVLDVPTAAARRVAGPLVAVLGSGFAWMPDGVGLLCHLVPEGRGTAPEPDPVPVGPIIQETAGVRSPARTWQDLLGDTHDEALFDYYATARIALVDATDGANRGSVRRVGAPGVFDDVSASPDGRHLLVTRLSRPYSYLFPASRFAHSVEVWTVGGEPVATVAELPLAESVPIGGVPTGPRNVQWSATEQATLVWVEALDGGDPDAEAEHRDRWLRWAAPFADEPAELARLEQRATGLDWMPETGFVTYEYDRDRRWTRALLWGRGSEPTVLEDRSVRDRYGDPGDLATQWTGTGRKVVRTDGDWIWRISAGAAPGGARPFLARTSLATGETEVVWRAAPGSYESVVGLVATGTERPARFVTRYESPQEPPNFRLRDLQTKTVLGLTDFPDPAPLLRTIEKQLVTYERSDGVALTAELYLPMDRDPDERLPLFVWAYPVEYNDPGTAGQYGGSPYRFTRVWGASPILLATQGWAVMMNATMPIVGDPETVNDTFVEQIVESGRAAIAAAAELGVADPDRAAVGGHSYGAFMTANLLAHSDLFRAGVARSGAYNRTLTPFGFQAERRTLWEAPELYFEISPFLAADRIDEPLLLVHGERDNNSGTFPMQSDRLYAAVKGHGGTVRYVVLPGEGHGYRGRESVLHVVAETTDWLDRHVKNAEPVEAGFSPEDPADPGDDSTGGAGAGGE